MSLFGALSHGHTIGKSNREEGDFMEKEEVRRGGFEAKPIGGRH